MARKISRISGLLAAMLMVIAAPVVAGEKSWDDASTIGVYGLMAAAVGAPLVNDDLPGALQAAGSIGAAKLVTHSLKEAFPEWRPDRSDRKSFPSAHTSTAFAAASTIFNREGTTLGVPAMVVATFIGVARIQADKHHWHDVAVGACIGVASGFLITRRRPDRTAVITPWGDTKGGGVSLAMRF